MRIDVFLLAEAARSSEKLYIHGGGITEIEAPILPWTHPQLAIVTRFAADREEIQTEHVATYTIFRPSAEPLFPPFHHVLAPTINPDEEPVLRYYDAVMTISPLTFFETGIHEVTLDVDGERWRAIELRVVERARDHESVFEFEPGDSDT